MEASSLTHVGRRGLLARRSPLLRLHDDARLIRLVRDGNEGAFEVIVTRYQARLLGFCRQILRSTEDAEDVLQEVFVNAHRALLADNKDIKLRPWLYRIARNRCLNHLRRPAAAGQDSMDSYAAVEAASTHERVQNREEFRQLLDDVAKLPETQRTALLLREMDALAYEEIAQTMETTVPSVKSLLVRARIGLAEASQARLLTCGEVRLELAEAAEGLGRASGPVRKHVRDCEQCQGFREQLRSNEKVLAALFPVGLLALAKSTFLAKLGLGGGSAGGAGAAGAGSGVLGGAGVTGGAGAVGGIGGAGIGGAGMVGAAVGTKAAAGIVTAALLTAGAVEMNKVASDPAPSPAAQERFVAAPPQVTGGIRAPAASAPLAGTKELKPEDAAAPADPAAATTTTATPTTTDPTLVTEPTTSIAPPTAPAPVTTPASTVTIPAQGSFTPGTTVRPPPKETPKPAPKPTAAPPLPEEKKPDSGG